MNLSIEQRDTATGPVLHLVGDLDYEQAPRLRRHLDTLVLRVGHCLLMDLSGLEFCDSSGITALLTAHGQARTAGAAFALAAVPPRTLRLLSIVGLDQVLTIRPHTDAPAR
ncbi:STAS domain-containing protein [Kitasatospora phosalacinea]|uniref:STAS domain-containing protein n=1 Tax=Kitasatospora phosalacinea TaxID=2065 RepID=UPI0005246A3D|nr:STAS domain-containing protein [Kitasatospora phosalacinea]